MQPSILAWPVSLVGPEQRSYAVVKSSLQALKKFGTLHQSCERDVHFGLECIEDPPKFKIEDIENDLEFLKVDGDVEIECEKLRVEQQRKDADASTLRQALLGLLIAHSSNPACIATQQVLQVPPSFHPVIHNLFVVQQ